MGLSRIGELLRRRDFRLQTLYPALRLRVGIHVRLGAGALGRPRKPGERRLGLLQLLRLRLPPRQRVDGGIRALPCLDAVRPTDRVVARDVRAPARRRAEARSLRRLLIAELRARGPLTE